MITPVYSWRGPELGDLPDGKKAFKDLAEDVEATMVSTTANTWTPEFYATGVTTSTSNPSGTKAGRYSVRNGWCSISAYIGVAAGFNAGTGPISFMLPVAGSPSAPEQELLFFMLVPNIGYFQGFIFPGGGSLSAYAYVPLAYFDNRYVEMQTADGSNAVDTGYPRSAAGSKTVQVGSTFAFGGRYRVG